MSSNSVSTTDGNQSITDVLLYAQSKLTRKQAVREIANVILRANMKPRTVQHALQLLKALLPSENTLPDTIDELFGAMLSSENDWRLAQYLIRHKQRPSFRSSPAFWSETSNTATSSSSSLSNQQQQQQQQQQREEIEIMGPTSSLFLPSSDSSENDSENESSSSSSSSSSDDDEDDDEDENQLLLALREAQQQQQQQNLTTSIPGNAVSTDLVNTLINSHSNLSSPSLSSDQRSQLVSNTHNRFAFLGSFKRRRSGSSSESSEVDPFYTRQMYDDDSDDHSSSASNSMMGKNNSKSANNKSCCFEINGYDLLDGGKRRRN